MAQLNGALLASAIVFILVICTHQGFAMDCFQCNSRDDTRCSQPNIPDDLIKPCPENSEGRRYTLCRKIVQTIDFEVNGLQPETRIIRSCGWDTTNFRNNCISRGGYGGRQLVCACDQSKCNDAGHAAITFGTFLVAAFVLTVAYRV